VADLSGLLLFEICEHREVPDLIRGKFANGEEDLEEDEDYYQNIPPIGMSVNLEELCHMIVRRIYSMLASAILKSRSNRVFMSCFTPVQIMTKKYLILYHISRSLSKLHLPDLIMRSESA
jgi:hypothetical protein